MKHFLSFCVAMCTILLASFFVSPSYAGPEIKKHSNYSFAKSNDLAQTNILNFEVLAFAFGPGNIPERITVPEPKSKDLTQVIKNDRSREKENRELKPKAYKDINPPSDI